MLRTGASIGDTAPGARIGAGAGRGARVPTEAGTVAGRHAVGERKVGVAHRGCGAGEARAGLRSRPGPRAVALTQAACCSTIARVAGARRSLAGVRDRINGVANVASVVGTARRCYRQGQYKRPYKRVTYECRGCSRRPKRYCCKARAAIRGNPQGSYPSR